MAYFNHYSEFNKKLQSDLPFFYFTLNERCQEDDDETDFDIPSGEVERLHKGKRNTREMLVFDGAKRYLPSRDKFTIRQTCHRFETALPPVPQEMLPKELQ